MQFYHVSLSVYGETCVWAGRRRGHLTGNSRIYLWDHWMFVWMETVYVAQLHIALVENSRRVSWAQNLTSTSNLNLDQSRPDLKHLPSTSNLDHHQKVEGRCFRLDSKTFGGCFKLLQRISNESNN